MSFNNFLIHTSNTFQLILNLCRIRRRYETDVRIDGKVVVITGANTGLGKEAALQLSLRGAQIIMGCRLLERAEDAIKDIKSKNSSADITALKLDLSSLTSVRQFAESVAQKVNKIDILINNAGVYGSRELTTVDGHEIHFGTNHLGHFLLTLSLMPLLKNSSKARVITVSSLGHSVAKINFDDINLRSGDHSVLEAYNQSKLANVLFTRELAKRLGSQSTVTTYCLHPGVVGTQLSRHSSPWVSNFLQNYLFVSPSLGVQTIMYCALEPTLDTQSGRYYDNCRRVDRMVSQAIDDESAAKLWQISSDLVKLEQHLKI